MEKEKKIMTNVINKATNKFTKGLVMDFSPENTGNEVLTHALNATFLTFNGNELSLQNDMGNARVETAFLPEGYIPVGTCEYGGIIYIVSYNPLEDKSLIGCFPSPERNISSDEMEISQHSIDNSDFQKDDGEIINNSKYVLLKEDNLNPGDKFIIQTDKNIYEERLLNLYKHNQLISNPILKISVVSIEESGKIIYLNNTLKLYNKNGYKYHILGSDNNIIINKPDIDKYRNVLSSGYNVFKSKTSGKLALLAELITIDSYSVTHSVVSNPDFDNEFDIYIHTEVSPMPESKPFFIEGTPVTPPSDSESRSTIIIKNNNYYLIPKLKYYYLKESQGTLDIDPNPINLFNEDNSKNDNFLNTTLENIYKNLEDNLKNIKLGKSGSFDFPKSNTYHGSDDNYLISNNQLDSNYLNYSDIKLGSIKIPKEIYSDHTFPFKYNYTLIPCMEYGKLENLKITNTINFDNIKNFEKSDFNCWRYRIDGNQLKLTFGAEIYDSISDEKVIGLFLEFYDHNGFVGSLSIDGDKKSYSGEFTRILNLDTPNVLSDDKIDDNKKSLTKCKDPRNVNIIETENGHSYFGHSCKIINGIWTYAYRVSDNQNPELKNRASESESDTAVPDDSRILHSNLIYGVKLYFKIRNNNDEISYKEKDPRILFTFPIYNNHYYNIKDFSELQPELKLALNYKLTDKSNNDVYSNPTFNIENGYYTQLEDDLSSSDNDLIQQYMKGDYDNSDLHATKYYLYKGKTELKLEVGLKKEYESIGFWSKGLEDVFTCDLLLMGDSTQNTHYYESDIPNLNYKENWEDINTLTFDDDTSSKFSINLNDSFTIDYKFVVGYNFNITNIRSTEVPVTTFCALCHKNNNKYNYEDFGIYYNGEENAYLSNAAIYNSGDSKNSILGLCKQVEIWKDDKREYKMDTYFKKIDSFETTDVEVDSGELNTNLFSRIKPYIGKLTFCQPHIHLIDNNYGVNIYYSSKLGKYAVTDMIDYTNEDGKKESTGGIAPTTSIYNYPRVNLSLNTMSLINHESEFISTVYFNLFLKGEDLFEVNTYFMLSEKSTDNWDHGTKPEECLREFIGLGPNELAYFNQYLLKTMKNVYVYNPDYNTLNIEIGDVNLQEYNVKFISNIISSNSKLDDKSIFNNYIYFFTGFKLSEYITNLCDKLGINEDEIKDQITFKPNYTYCGIDSLNLYLITNLNYNIPSPKTLIDELSFKESIIIRHEDGNIDFFESNKIPNNNLLYGYDKDLKKLILLDVTNYTIEDGGKLKLKSETYNTSQDKIIYVTPSNDYYLISDNVKYDVIEGFKKSCFKYTSITINDLIYNPYSKHKLFIKKDNKCFYPIMFSNDIPTSRNIIYYRKFGNYKDVNKLEDKDWSISKTEKLNRLYLYSGPCFVKY